MSVDYRLIKFRGKFAIYWRDEGGRHRHSLGTDSRAEADRQFADFIKRRETAALPKVITVAFAWEGYRKALGEKPAATTMRFEWKALGPRLGDRGADALTEADCLAYADARRAQGRSDGTIWTELGRLRSALKWAEGKGLIIKAPKIYRPERPEPRDKRLTRKQIGDFLKACAFPHIKLFATLAVTTGARMGAILDLKWARVDFAQGTIAFRDPDRQRTKKGRATVPINEQARKALMEAREAAVSDYVIEWGGGKVASVKKGIATVGKAAGLPWVTAHVFRHSAACAMAERGIPMEEIAQFLGHSDSRITEKVYARFSPLYLRKAADALEFGDE